MMKFWLDKGIDGFRLDVIACISKDISFPELPKTMNAGDWFPYYAQGPHLHEYLQEMNREVFSKYDCMNVGEMSFVTTEDALLFVDEDRRELQTFYHFDHTGVGVSKENFMYADDSNWDLVAWKNIFWKWDQVFEKKGWGTIYLGNHDMSRMVSRFGNDSEKYRALSAKMLHTFILSMRATPYIYNGDELGMTNTNHTEIEKYQDVYTINYYNGLKQKGGDYAGFLKSHATISRDNARTPMQWNQELHAGFSEVTPWLALNNNYPILNVAEQENNPGSVLHYFRRMIQLRKNHETLVYGAFELVDEKNDQIFAYKRVLDREVLLVVLNFSDAPAVLTTSLAFSNSHILISNLEQPQIDHFFRPYAAVIYQIEQ
jgi:oligo-1,6-glucosidase